MYCENVKQEQRIFRFSFLPSDNVNEPLLISALRVTQSVRTTSILIFNKEPDT